MPALSTKEATERLAKVVEMAKQSTLGEVYAELFPEAPASPLPSAGDMARYIRDGLEAEEIVDLWNVVFPGDRNVRYDEEAKEVRYNEDMVGSSD